MTLTGLDIEIRIAFKGQAKALKQFRDMLVAPKTQAAGFASAKAAGTPSAEILSKSAGETSVAPTGEALGSGAEDDNGAGVPKAPEAGGIEAEDRQELSADSLTYPPIDEEADDVQSRASESTAGGAPRHPSRSSPTDFGESGSSPAGTAFVPSPMNGGDMDQTLVTGRSPVSGWGL